MRFKRLSALVTMLAFAAALLAGCGGSSHGSASGGSSLSNSGGTPQRGGNLVVDIVKSPDDFDIDTTADNESIWGLDDMAEGLFSNAPNGHSVVPWLATGYTVSPDKLTYTFQLRHGVKFSNGQPMTSKDVVFSITQAASAADGANNYVDTEIKKVVADGPNAVKIVLNFPWAPLLADLAMYANDIFPDHFMGQSAQQFFQHPVGTGPFKMSQWVKGQYVRLTRNPYYWQHGKPYLNSITLQAVTDSNTRVIQLRGGQAQVIEQAPFALMPSLQSAGFKLGLFPSSRIDYLTMNELFKPFKDPHVRLAVAEALNRPAIMKSVFFGHGQVANSPYMPIVSYYSPVGLPAHNLAAAKAELAKSAYPRGGFTVDFLAAGGDPVQAPVAQIVASELAPLGIKVKIHQLDTAEVQDQEHAFHYGMRETLWTNDIIDPDEYTSFVICGSASACGGVYANYTHFDDPRIDKLTLQGEKTLGSSARAAIYLQIQRLAARELPEIWLGYSPFAYVFSPKVHDYLVYTQGNTHFENTWLSK
jgi:peptide/nickel transport system substrate-binding protein